MVNPHYQHGPLWCSHLISSMASWVMLPPHLERHLLYGESILSTWHSMVQPLNQQHGLLGDASTSSWASPSVWWIHIINTALYGQITSPSAPVCKIIFGKASVWWSYIINSINLCVVKLYQQKHDPVCGETISASVLRTTPISWTCVVNPHCKQHGSLCGEDTLTLAWPSAWWRYISCSMTLCAVNLYQQ